MPVLDLHSSRAEKERKILRQNTTVQLHSCSVAAAHHPLPLLPTYMYDPSPMWNRPTPKMAAVKGPERGISIEKVRERKKERKKNARCLHLVYRRSPPHIISSHVRMRGICLSSSTSSKEKPGATSSIVCTHNAHTYYTPGWGMNAVFPTYMPNATFRFLFFHQGLDQDQEQGGRSAWVWQLLTFSFDTIIQSDSDRRPV